LAKKLPVLHPLNLSTYLSFCPFYPSFIVLIFSSDDIHHGMATTPNLLSVGGQDPSGHNVHSHTLPSNLSNADLTEAATHKVNNIIVETIVDLYSF